MKLPHAVRSKWSDRGLWPLITMSGVDARHLVEDHHLQNTYDQMTGLVSVGLGFSIFYAAASDVRKRTLLQMKISLLWNSLRWVIPPALSTKLSR